jgi:hypothetical protein
MTKGWVRLHRQIEDWEFYFEEPFTRAQAWTDLILLANFKTGTVIIRGNNIIINRGQVGRSEEFLSRRWQWSRGKVRRYLAMLKTRQQIEQQPSSILSLITIINYDRYQLDDTTDGTTDGQQTVQQTVQVNKNVKKEKNEKKESHIRAPLKKIGTLFHRAGGI